MKERELISRLVPKLPSNSHTILGAGDDCAVVRGAEGDGELLLKVDAVVEGVHFTAEDSPELVGRKALARCFSDIAAMGGRPEHALVSLGLPSDFDSDYVEKVYDGLVTLASDFEVAVVGGETVHNPGAFSLSVTVVGHVQAGSAVQRSGAVAGEAIFVSGILGGSANGHHLRFVPRIEEASWLVEQFSPSSMIDLSDGLVTDLGHVLKASGVGALLDETFIPISREAKLRARESESAKSPLLAALTDGEDFELLFTIPAAEAVQLKDAWRERFPDVPLSLIGRIDNEAGLRMKQMDGVRSLGSLDGFDHFQ